MSDQELRERVEAAERKLAERERSDLQQKVAAKSGIPLELATMIKGTTEAEMAADVKVLAKHLAPKAPETEAGRGYQRKAAPAAANPMPNFKFGRQDVTPWPNAGAPSEGNT